MKTETQSGFTPENLLKSARWHLKQGHKLVCKTDLAKGGMPEDWTSTEGDDWLTIRNAVNAGCQSIGWVLTDTDYVVIDVDNHGNSDGMKSKSRLAEMGLLPPTYTVRTGGGGYHHVYSIPKHAIKPTRRIPEFPSIDFLSGRCYLVIEGSLHQNKTHIYKRAENSPDVIATLPPGIAEMCEKQRTTETETDMLAFSTEEDVLKAIEILDNTEPPKEHDIWVRLVFAAFNTAHATGSIPLMTTAVQQWSAKDEDLYDVAASRRIVNMAETVEKQGPRPGTAGLSSLVWWEMHVATEHSEERQQALDDNCGFSVTRGDQVRDFVAPDELIENLLARKNVSMILATYNTGKSALALDLAVHVSAGVPWNDLQVKQVAVFYFAIEGENSIKLRLKAYENAPWQNLHDIHVFGPESINLTSGKDRSKFEKRLFRYMKKTGVTPGLLILDTLAEATPGLDENTPEIGAVGAWAKALAVVTDSNVVIVHHVPKGGSTSRGHTSLPAVMDTIITLEPQEGSPEVTGRVTKQRDLPTRQESFTYKIIGWELPEMLTTFGKPLTTARIELLTALGNYGTAPKQDVAIEAIRNGVVADETLWSTLSRAKVAEMLGIKQGTVGIARRALIEEGFLLDEGRGFIRNPEHSVE